jgi:outer membrane protein assembly factor BamA
MGRSVIPIIKSAIAASLTPSVILISTLLFSSCNITRNVPEEKYLLNNSVIDVKSKEIKPSDLEPYLRQRPNKRILGFRFHLRVYNSANPYKFKGINGWLKTIGEEPVILDTFLVSEGARNIQLYLKSKGYYQSAVKDTIVFSKRKANVLYTVSPQRPYRIGKLTYVIEDTAILRIVRADSINSLIKRNQLFDMDNLQEERSRIEAFLKNSGYYFFTKDLITFTADTAFGTHRVDLLLNIRNRYILGEDGKRTPQNYMKYKINRVFLYPNYDPIVFNARRRESQLDTVINNNVRFVFADDPGINLDVVYQATLIRPGAIYSNDIVQKTQSNLSSLKLYKMVNISFAEQFEDTKAKDKNEFIYFEEETQEDTLRYGLLNCHIQLTPHTLQSYQVELVGTNTTGTLGAEGNLNYQHKNLFKGAEVFDIKFRGLIETVEQKVSLNNSLELGGSVGLNFPRFLSPFAGREYSRKYSPRTQLAASYNYQRRPDYIRTVASLQFGYTWKNSKYLTHGVNPIEINAINIPLISSAFQAKIDATPSLKYSYQNQIVTVSSYSLTFNNQNIQKATSYTYLRYNVELSGNLLSTAFELLDRPKASNGTYQILRTSFSQFVRSDLNITYHQVVNQDNTFVYRVFAGVGYPYGNSMAMPFEKKYFSGGANGIRAWQARALGPGSYYLSDKRFPNQSGDIKLEANLEYRFKLFWQLEGALFADAGNIWSFPGLDDTEGAEFKMDQFYRQIALGSGLGLRVNLGFLTIRLDFGYKVYDPARNPDADFRPWVPFQQKFVLNQDVAFNFGIGYPF